jgi:uncharacterized protein (DUF2062 family)
MNPYTYNLIFPALSFCISIGCFFFARRKFKTNKHLFKQWAEGTVSESSVTLIWAKIVGASVLGIVMLLYTFLFVIVALPLFFSDR